MFPGDGNEFAKKKVVTMARYAIVVIRTWSVNWTCDPSVSAMYNPCSRVSDYLYA